MKNGGQVFTGDMIFAIILVVAFLSISTQAYNIASGQMQSYSNRYSLERITNDTADILVKTSGDPINWETRHPSDLNTLGLAKLNPNNKPITNYIDSNKISKLATEISGDNWTPTKENSDQAILNFFNTKNFEINVMDNGTNFWKIWPGWESGGSSGVENSLEVAVVNRIVYGRIVTIKGRSPPLTLDPPVSEADNLFFWVSPEELEVFDWYLYVENENTSTPPKLSVTLNYDTGDAREGDFNFGSSGSRRDIPGYIRIDNETDSSLRWGKALEGDNWNFISANIAGHPEDFVKIYVVITPPGMNPERIPLGIKKRSLILQVKMWR